MTTLNAHYDGARVVLDDPMPASVPPGTPLQVVVLNGEAAGGGLLDEIAKLAQPLGLPADFAEQHEHYVKGKPKR